jgi:hypothetical protein
MQAPRNASAKADPTIPGIAETAFLAIALRIAPMNTTWRPFLTFTILATLAISAQVAETQPANSAVVRVALVAVTTDPRLQNIRDLAEAELAEAGELQVLERQQVDRLLAEQKLSLSGWVDADRAVKAGKVLAADLLAVVESTPKSQGATIVIFDPASGVRLWDSALSTEDGGKCAEAIANAVRQSAAKRGKIADLHTICLMTVRNADLPHDMDGFCDAVGRLLERDLVGSAKLALLERSRLENVEHERALNAGAAAADLFPSLVIVELDVSRSDSSGGLRAVAFLSDSAGKQMGKLTALTREHDAVALAGTLAGELAAHLKAPAGAKVDRLAEASRFYAEAQLWTDASDFLRAVPPAEAAHALAPDNVLYRAKLAHAVVMCGVQRSPNSAGRWSQPAGSFPMLVRGAALLPDILPLSYQADAASGARIRAMLSDAAEGIRRYMNWRTLDHFQYSPQALFPPEDLAGVMESLRRHLLLEDARMLEDVNSPATMQRYTIHFAPLLDDAEWVFSRSAGEWAVDHERLSGQWLDLYVKYQPEHFAQQALDAIAIDSPFIRKTAWDHVAPALRRVRRWEPGPADIEHLEAVREKLQHAADPMVRRYGDWCAMSIAVTRAAPSHEQMKQCIGDYLEAKKRELRQPQLSGDKESRRQIYYLMAKADGLLEATPMRAHFGPELLDFALSRHEVEGSIVQQGIIGSHEFLNLSPEEVARRIAAIERLHEMLAQPDCQVLDAYFTDANCQVMLARLRHPDEAHAGLATTRPSGNITKLLDVIDANEGVEQVMAPAIDGNSVYAVGAVDEKPGPHLQFQLLRMPLAGGAIEHLGSLPTRQFPFHPLRKFRSISAMHGATASCVAEGYFAAATWEDGILIYRTDSDRAQAVTEKEGLPSSCGHSVAILDGKVYAGLGADGKDGYLVSCQLDSRRIDVVASNLRKDRRSPFDDGAVFTIRGLTPDPARHRLIIAIQRYEPKPQLNGIWEYTPQTDRWRLLLPMPLFPRENNGVTHGALTEILGVARLRDDKLPIATTLGVFIFNLKDDSARVVFQHDVPTMALLPISRQAPAEEGTTAPGRAGAVRCWPPFPRAFEYLPPFIWTGCCFTTDWTRTHLKTGRNEHFSSFRDDFTRFDPAWMESSADGSKLIVADFYGIWMISNSQ